MTDSSTEPALPSTKLAVAVLELVALVDEERDVAVIDDKLEDQASVVTQARRCTTSTRRGSRHFQAKTGTPAAAVAAAAWS